MVANLTAELQKNEPCRGVISRDLMELELGALNQDREFIEESLGLLLSSFAGASSKMHIQQAAANVD